MRYLLLHLLEENAEFSPEDDRGVEAWADEMQARRVTLHGGYLAPVSDARTVRVRGGEVLVSDGPYAETKEQIAGFNVVECASLEEAIEIASRHPTARIGTFELRPFGEP
jgi:hypothetical protein